MCTETYIFEQIKKIRKHKEIIFLRNKEKYLKYLHLIYSSFENDNGNIIIRKIISNLRSINNQPKFNDVREEIAVGLENLLNFCTTQPPENIIIARKILKEECREIEEELFDIREVEEGHKIYRGSQQAMDNTTKNKASENIPFSKKRKREDKNITWRDQETDENLEDTRVVKRC